MQDRQSLNIRNNNRKSTKGRPVQSVRRYSDEEIEKATVVRTINGKQTRVPVSSITKEKMKRQMKFIKPTNSDN